MCGINLVVAEGGRVDLIQRMNAVTRHRGPDDVGVYCAGNFSLGNVRLAIRDVAHGKQPMVDQAAGVAVSFNGEVWNYGELRALLQQRGHVFHTDCDTEVILHGYKEWGTDLFRRLHADFGLAIVDSRQKRAIIARDRLGIKPLYYTLQGKLAAVSSEMKGLLAVLPAESERHRPLESLHPDHLYDHGSITEIDGISMVLPGEFVELTWQHGRASAKRSLYYRWDYFLRQDDEETAIGNIAGLLEDAIRRQVVSERPVAVAVSGGIDSSIVAAVASKHIDLMCYSIGALDVTETENARALTDYLKERGHRILGFREIRVDEEGIRQCLAPSLFHLESSYPMQADMAVVTYILAREISRDGFKVLLSGEGADELFLGYHSYFQRRKREGRLQEAMIEQVENLHRYNNARVDKSFMAHGVEPRVPFQHAPLVEYVISLHPDMKMGNPTPGNGYPDMQKYVLRRAAERMRCADGGPLLPAEVIWRRKEYYAKGMDLPGLIGRALGLLTQGLADAEAAQVRFASYKQLFSRLLLDQTATQREAA